MFGRSKKEKAKRNIFSLLKAGEEDAVIEFMGELGFDINMKNSSGNSLLHESIRQDRAKVFGYLLSRNANINMKNCDNKSPLILATEKGLVPYVEQLLMKNALTDLRQDNGSTALILAASKNDVAILKLLLDSDADMNIKGRSGGTAIAWAVFNRHYEATKILLSYGADIYKKNTDALDAVYYAKTRGNDDIAELIEKENIKNLKLIKAEKQKLLDKPKDQWIVTGDKEISHINTKAELNRTITEIFNFQAETLITIIENNITKAESTVKEVLVNLNDLSLSMACQKYEDMTGEKLATENKPKQAQPWNNKN